MSGCRLRQFYSSGPFRDTFEWASDVGAFDVDDVRQIAGYARDRKALKRIGIQDAEMQNSAVVPCVIIYPESSGNDVKFDGSSSPID